MNDSQTSVPLRSGRNPWIAFLLSLVFPGLGHLYLGRRGTALAYALMMTGIWISYYSSDSYLTRLAVLFIFPFVVYPAAKDAFLIARGKKKPVTGEESKLYVIWMLCCAGPFALPLLWQNKKFTITVKVIWTIIVVSIAAVFIGSFISIGKGYEQILQVL